MQISLQFKTKICEKEMSSVGQFFFLLYFDKKSIFCQNCAFIVIIYIIVDNLGWWDQFVISLAQFLTIFYLLNPNFDKNLGNV